MTYLAGIEIGGTKTICVAGQPGQIERLASFPTGSREQTLGEALAILQEWRLQRPFATLGIASFGPLRLDPAASDYGRLLATPKPGWTDANIVQIFETGLRCPVALDTDVNGAALAERAHGAGRGANVLVYLTIGTGIGGGILIDGQPVRGAMHPEIGHLRLRRTPGDTFAGTCSFHGNCIEGLASGPALEARFGVHPSSLCHSDPRWDTPAHDLAELFTTLFFCLSAEKIVVGGGVALKQQHLICRATALIAGHLNGYLPGFDEVFLGDRVCLAELGEDAGPLGALEVARQAQQAVRC